jgi:hypothetical protein
MAEQAYDDSPPRNGTILFYTVLTVFLLVCVKFLLDSYFSRMMDAEIHDKVLTVGMEEVQAMRASEKQKLEQGAMPIESAMKTLAQRGRMAMPEIQPKSGPNAPAIEGWREMKRSVAPAAAAAAPTSAPAPEAAAPAEGAGH